MADCVKSIYYCSVLALSEKKKNLGGKGMMYGIIVMHLHSDDALWSA